MPDRRAELLLEIGCEEIPAGWLPSLTDELRERFVELAAAEHLEPEDGEAHSTPRRLVLRADLLARQPDREEEVWGPALKSAKDAGGQWTRAALGFASKQGITADALETGPKPGKGRETHLLVRRRVAGRPTADVLPALLAATLRALSFPKRMSWDAWLDDGKGAFPFGRPIRWLVTLFDGLVVPFAIHELVAGARGGAIVHSGDKTSGHRFFPRGKGGAQARVRSFDELKASLEELSVTLFRTERRVAIREGLFAVEREIVDDHGLLEDWADLVEHPAVVIGAIPEEFQSLPREVLETVLVHHQKYIPLLADGRTVSRFAAVTDTDGSSASVIVRGMERVVVARLRDAAFFFSEDLKRPLSERVDDLAGVAFHAKLGSYREKAERLVKLVGAIAPQSGAAREAALLAKADLTTLMVREFTELQGVMGGIYLRMQNADPAVAEAVRWHYHPVSIEEKAAPAGQLDAAALPVFAAVSLADKLDTLAGYFGLGLAPTGSSDPYGLRRAAQGAVRVLLDFWPGAARPSLRALLAQASAAYPGAAAQAGELEAFLLDRLRYLCVARGYPADEVEAVLGARDPDALDDPHEAWVRLRALHSIRSEAPDDFRSLATAFKRARNILEQAKETAPAGVEPGLIEADAERALYDAVARLGSQDGGYESRLRALATLREPVDRFFDPAGGVFVMTDDLARRGNRLALLEQMRRLFYRIADISKLGG
jgi:glycyl-tRNA synthetase beta chain